MASSELDIEPDLNKAPPHVEGELLKQNTKALLNKRGWKKYYFVVLKDKLQYFDKREDCKQNKEPVAFIRMSQVTSITEVVFNGVPKKHHLNSGFSLEAFHPVTQQQITLNLLAETPEDMRYWVHALRYIKAYWAKLELRETVLNEEQERKILERILCGGFDDGEEVIPGEYTLDEDAQPSMEDEACLVGSASTLYFADGSKVKIHLSPTETTSDLLDKEEVKEHLTSSAANVWLVDSVGNDMILGPTDNPGLFPGKTHMLFAIDHAHRVLPVFIAKKDFKCITVPSNITASQVMEHHDISVQLDLNGITNRGLFLKSETEELMFTAMECPCEVLFEVDENKNLVRLPVGKLVVHNKSIGGGRGNFNVTNHLRKKRTIYKNTRTESTEQRRIMEEKSAEEKARSDALDLLFKRQRKINTSPKINRPQPVPELSESTEVDLGDWVITTGSSTQSSPDRRNSGHGKDSRGLEDPVVVGGAVSPVPSLTGGGGGGEKRQRSAAMSDASSSRGAGGMHSRSGSSKLSDVSPSDSPVRVRSRSKSPRRLPDVPASTSTGGSPTKEPNSTHSSPLQRRYATRVGSTSSSRRDSPTQSRSGSTKSRSGSNDSGSGHLVVDSNVEKERKPTPSFMPGKGPTIRLTNAIISPGDVTPPSIGSLLEPRVTRSRTATVRATIQDLSHDSRSSAFGYTPTTSPVPDPAHSPAPSPSPTPQPADTKTAPKTTPISHSGPEDTRGKDQSYSAIPVESESPPEKLLPMFIDFRKLQIAHSPGPEVAAEDGKEESVVAEAEAAPAGPLPIKVTSPNLLKVILLQSSETADSTVETQPMDFISLSGVVLCNKRGVWQLQPGHNYHDNLPFDCDDHTETFRLSPAIKAVFNHTHKRWHVLPLSSGGPQNHAPNKVEEESDSVASGSTEHAQGSLELSNSSLTQSSANTLYMSKKVVVTEIGSAFQACMSLFGQTRDNAEKKKIGSDMTNPNMGHMIRGRFCSALARLLLDGLRPYRLQGIVQDNIWDVTIAFCNAAQSDPTSSLVTPAIEKLVFQPINAMKTRLRDDNIKFRTFVCLAMSKGMLNGWLEALPKQRNVLRKYYLPSSFLSLVAKDDSYAHLYQQMLLALEPMDHLPFDLSIDFELRQMANQAKNVGEVKKVGVVTERGAANGEGSGSKELLSVNGITSEPSSPSSPQRPNVVIKTVAATGQKSPAGNVLNAVWDTSAMATSPSHHVEEPDGTNVTDRPKEKIEQTQPNQPTPPRQGSTTSADSTTSFKRFKGTFMKRLNEGFQQLNAGGLITGVPKGGLPASKTPSPTPKPEPRPQKAPAAGERRVEALYTNICDDSDELCFTKGDLLTVKEQINSEWLICSLGNRTGIVPMNYIKPA